MIRLIIWLSANSSLSNSLILFISSSFTIVAAYLVLTGNHCCCKWNLFWSRQWIDTLKHLMILKITVVVLRESIIRLRKRTILSLVPLLVLAQLGLLLKALPAFIALKRLFSRVNTEVVLQVASLIEVTLTNPAHKNWVKSVGVFIDDFFLQTRDSIDSDWCGRCIRLMLELHELVVVLVSLVNMVHAEVTSWLLRRRKRP